MDYGEHEEQEEEMGRLPVSASYESLGNSSRPKMGSEAVLSGRKTGNRYRECLKNHAVGIGGHALDGCGEFMAAGEEGTLDALKCAACNCHRNFHRKETDGGGGGGGAGPYHQHHQFNPYYRTPTGYLTVAPHHHRPLALPSTSGGGGGGNSREDQEDMSNPSGGSGGVGGGGGGSKKRFRTKFTQEQKDKMLAFAERVGWRIQKHDEAAVQQFCNETSVKRHVLKVWMHNNKHTLGTRRPENNNTHQYQQDEQEQLGEREAL
ncbi:zinc-finger homeodomain protein 1-like [Macadamia integrifolia]|uniref:zinc-finger homeodomain protein 1-like n=1 Tax=Macadamia integrifolia TaxID=60698 RepID=UPI001C4F5A58|nr:zinc-finger homeodomain protein 1-like [Macadamia integrifolia]